MHQRLVEVLALLRHERQRLGQPENVIGDVGGGAHTARRTAGLDYNRLNLRRRHDAQRPLHLKELADVIDSP